MNKDLSGILNEVECPEQTRALRGGVEGQCYVYLLLCSDNSIYCGSTFDLKDRLKRHNAGEAAVWTKNRRPVKLIYYEIQKFSLLARRRERQIKG